MLIGKVPYKYVFNKVKVDVFRVLMFSLALHVAKLVTRYDVPDITTSLPAIMGTSISLLLAFNVNQSYDRWWEARKIWGAIVNDSRTLVLQLASFAGDGEAAPAAPALRRVALRQIVWCYSLGQSLRGQPPLSDQQKQLLCDADARRVVEQTNKPLALLMCHHLEIRALHQKRQINDFQQVQLDATLVRLCDAMGRAERIKSTVFPVTYRLFVHLFIYLFLMVLSVALVTALGILEVPIIVLLASTFFLLEKTALHLQDPFSDRPTDTAMTAIARTIEINLRQLIDDKEVPPPLPPEGFYLM